MGVVVSVAAGATIPLSAIPLSTIPLSTIPLSTIPLSSGPATAEVPVVALVNHSAADDALFLGQFCGGVPATSLTVVTATHCVAGRTAGSIDVVTGTSDLCAGAGDGAGARALGAGERRQVDAVSALPHSGGTLSVLTLDAELSTDPSRLVSPSRLPLPGARVAGWGWGRDAVSGTPACVLRRVDLLVVAVDVCRSIAEATYEAEDRPSGSGVSLCTVPLDGMNTCNGDSGGPVTIVHPPGSGEVRVVAITMSGEGCGPADRGLAVVPSWVGPERPG